MKNWKTSTLGVCVLLVSAQSAVKFDVAGHLAMTQKDWFTLAFGFLAAGIGLLQKDAQ